MCDESGHRRWTVRRPSWSPRRAHVKSSGGGSMTLKYHVRQDEWAGKEYRRWGSIKLVLNYFAGRDGFKGMETNRGASGGLCAWRVEA
jgi:hypothetical protein